LPVGVVLSETAHWRLMLTALIGGIAEFQRELIRTRTGEGRAAPPRMASGIGQKPMLTHHQQQVAATSLGPSHCAVELA